MQTDGATTPSAPAECTLLQLPVARSIMNKQVVIPAAIVIGNVLQHQKKNPASGKFFIYFSIVSIYILSLSADLFYILFAYFLHTVIHV